MSIKVNCPNGHALVVAEKHAGKLIRCPKCQQGTQVPAPPPQTDPDESDYQWEVVDDANSVAESTDTGYEVLDEEELPASKSLRNSRPSKQTPRSSARRSDQESSAHSDTDAWLGKTVIMAGVAGLLITLGLVSWLIWGRNPQPPGPDPVAVQPRTTPVTPPSVTPSGSLPNSEPAKPVSQPPPPPPQLRREVLADSVHAYQLPATTWGFAYDEVSTRFAVTHDQAGILVFDLNQAELNQLTTVAQFPLPSLPMAVCCKPLGEKRWFVFASEKENQLHVVDADTLVMHDPIMVGPDRGIVAVAGSPNPDDPYVYFSHSEGISRIELNSKVREKMDLESHSKGFTEIVMSSDGLTMFLRPSSTEDGLILRSADRSLTKWPVIGDWDRHSDPDRLPVRLKGRMAIGRFVTSPETRSRFSELTFEPCLEFQNHPLLIGIRDHVTTQKVHSAKTRRHADPKQAQPSLVVASANDQRELLSISLPVDWRYESVRDRHLNPRNEWGTSHGLRFAMCESLADNRNNRGLICVSDYLLVIPAEQLPVTQEPPLAISAQIPKQVRVGQLVEIPISVIPQAATIEVVLNSDGLRDTFGSRGKLRILGAKEDPASAGQTLRLAADVFLKQEILYVRDLSPVKQTPLPFPIQIDDEVMTVTGVDEFKDALEVKRTNPQIHRTVSPVFLVDKLKEAAQEVRSDLPVISNQVFRWTPSEKQVGQNVARIRAKMGEFQRDWLWEIEVIAETGQTR